MLRNLKGMEGWAVRAMDRDIGTVYGFLFDEETWTVRYMVVDTGGWLPGRKVLISPEAFGPVDAMTDYFPVTCSSEQVESSPEIEADAPVSRQKEAKLHDHYGWSYYWLPVVDKDKAQEEPATRPVEEGDPHLRSTKAVEGYHIDAADGELGHVQDFVSDDKLWVIRYVVIDTRNWLPGRQVLIPPEWIQDVEWEGRKLSVNLKKEVIENAPEFDPALPITREYEQELYAHYGRPKYWV